jgi:hypothetical protein
VEHLKGAALGFVGDKHSSLLRKSTNYSGKKFYRTGPWAGSVKPIYSCNLRILVISKLESLSLAASNRTGWKCLLRD